MLGRMSFIILMAVLVAGSAHAGVTPGDGVLILNLGYANGKAAYTGETFDGGIIGLDYQKMDWDSPVSFGFSIGYGKMTQTVTGLDASADTVQADNTITSVPIYLGGKYWLGDGEGRFQGYIGAAFGMYFSQLETNVTAYAGRDDQAVGGDYSSQTALGFGLGIPVGVAVGISESMMLTGNYTLNWLWDNEFLDNDIVNAFSIGIAYNFGN